MSIVRIAAVAAALVMCAWFAVGLRQAIDTDAARSIIDAATIPTAAQAERAGSLLASAGLLNPDSELQLLRSTLALRRGDSARARQLAFSVARGEPMNMAAWVAYGQASADDPAAFRLALAHVRELTPAVTRSR